MIAPTITALRTAFTFHWYKFFDRGAFNLNLIGLRNVSAFDIEEYNDLICCVYRETEDGPLVIRSFKATTDPGKKARARSNKRTAILVPGQYRGAYLAGQHKGRPALVQQGTAPVSIYRVTSFDSWPFDRADIETGYFGINIHDMLGARSVVSNGCQGCHSVADHKTMLDIAAKSAKRYGPYITYTLLDWKS